MEYIKVKTIPKYIEKAIKERAKAADKFNELDILISQWCDSNCGPYNIEDTWGYVDTLTNPYEAAERTILEIKKSFDNNINRR